MISKKFVFILSFLLSFDFFSVSPQGYYFLQISEICSSDYVHENIPGDLSGHSSGVSISFVKFDCVYLSKVAMECYFFNFKNE